MEPSISVYIISDFVAKVILRLYFLRNSYLIVNEKFLFKMVSKQAEQLSLKLMGISPLHGSHPAAPFASGATSSHGLRLYGSIIITIAEEYGLLRCKMYIIML